MSRRHGTLHGVFGFVSVILAVKLLVKKGLFLINDLVTHEVLRAPLELLLVELPVSVFGTVGNIVVTLTGTELPPAAVGLVIMYPLLVALVVAVVEHPSRRVVASYWLGATVVTSAAVTMSLGMAPDPAGVGSGLTYHLVNHTIAELLRSAVLALGGLIAAVGDIVGLNIDETIGLVIAVSVVAVCYGIIWEWKVGHGRGR